MILFLNFMVLLLSDSVLNYDDSAIIALALEIILI